MFINFTPHNAKGASSKAFSCANIFEYLEKEDNIIDSDISINYVEDNEKLGFFNQDNINIPKEKVINDIDNNRGKRNIKESNFYMINISPSYVEQGHMLNRIDNFLKDKIEKENLKMTKQDYENTKDLMMRDLMMNYSREVMKDYASNFNREINGEKITDKDLLYFGRVETRRSYNFKDKDVIENKKLLDELNKRLGSNYSLNDKFLENDIRFKRDYFTKEIIREGSVKGGLNYHVHIVVSRHDNTNDKNNKISLSPMSKYRVQESKLNNQETKSIGFDRDTFFQKSEDRFDKVFNYQREYSNTYEANKRGANTKGSRESMKKQNINIVDLGKNIGTNKIKNEIKKYTGVNLNSPTANLRMQMSQQLGINIPNKLTVPTNPVSLTFKAVKSVVKTIEKGYGM